MQRLIQRSLLIGGGIAIGITLAVTSVLAFKYISLEKDPQAAAKAASDNIVARVGNLIELPTDETPTVAQVHDKTKLNRDPFFDKAENGDYILVYAKNKMALIYRQSENKLINVGAIHFGDTSAASSVRHREQ